MNSYSNIKECNCPCHDPKIRGLCGIDACCAWSGKLHYDPAIQVPIKGRNIMVLGDDENSEQLRKALKSST